MTRVKICGIRRLEDALVAAEVGADFIGLVFVPNRRRRVEVDAAREIVQELRRSGWAAIKAVGLFADQLLDEVNQIIDSCGLDLVQLCGSEPLDYCGEVHAEVIKVLHVPPTADTEPASEGIIADLADQIRRHRNAGHLITLDSSVEGLQGGTGQRFDWGIAARLSHEGHPFLLAGGLTPEDVALAVEQVQPWGVDVSSGVETEGDKDADKILAFVRNAREVLR